MRTRKEEENHALELAIAYIHGRLEAQIEAFARSAGLPSSELARRVGKLLCPLQSGEVLGIENSVPTLSSSPAERGDRESKVEVANAPRGKRPYKRKENYWSKMTPEERKKEMSRRRRVSLQKKGRGA